MFKFTQGDIVKRVTKSRNLNSWSCIVEWWIYKVSTVHNDYVTLEWIVWNISSDSLIIYQMQVWDYVRRIKEDYEDVIVWCIYKISSILPRDIKIEWSVWAYTSDYFEPVLTTDDTTIGICPSSILVDDTVDDENPVIDFSNFKPIRLQWTSCPPTLNVGYAWPVGNVGDSIYLNPITPMKTFNEYAIEAFMSNEANRTNATNALATLNKLNDDLALAIEATKKVRSVILGDLCKLQTAMSSSDIEVISALIAENAEVKEYVERFMENTLVQILPIPENTNKTVQDKFK